MRIQLRIVAGSLRGRKLVCVVSDKLRPAPKMVREALFSILGDGELNEGQCWEAFQFIAHHNLNNLTLFIDYNKQQLDGALDEVIQPFDLAAKFRAFGFEVQTIKGDDIAALLAAVRPARATMPRSTLRRESEQVEHIAADIVPSRPWFQLRASTRCGKRRGQPPSRAYLAVRPLPRRRVEPARRRLPAVGQRGMEGLVAIATSTTTATARRATTPLMTGFSSRSGRRSFIGGGSQGWRRGHRHSCKRPETLRIRASRRSRRPGAANASRPAYGVASGVGAGS